MDGRIKALRRKIAIDPEDPSLKAELVSLCLQIQENPTEKPCVVAKDLILSYDSISEQNLDLGYSFCPSVYERISEGKLKSIWEAYIGDFSGTKYAVLKCDHPRYGMPVYLFISTYYGSCSGCDSFMASNNSERYDLLKDILTTTRQFWNLSDLLKYIEESEEYSVNSLTYHKEAMEKLKELS